MVVLDLLIAIDSYQVVVDLLVKTLDIDNLKNLKNDFPDKGDLNEN